MAKIFKMHNITPNFIFKKSVVPNVYNFKVISKAVYYNGLPA